MSCHGTPGNSAVTSLACALAHTPSDEVSRRFHDLKRESPDTQNPSEAEVVEWLERQALAVRNTEGLSAWRAERLLVRIDDAIQSARQGNRPDGATWHAWQNLRAACDEAHTHQWLATTSGLEVPISEATPQAIDETLAELWDRINRERERKRMKERDHLHASRNVGRYGITERTIAERQQAIAESETTLEALLDKAAPYEAEYARRGGWSRYFRVITSGQGHVHSSMACHSCYPTTVYVWLPALSGQGQDEAVDEYGSEMCSHCFPDVTTHPRYQSRGRIAEEAARARVDERAAREALKAAKAIAAPDGSPLRIGGGRYPETIRSEVTAERILVQKIVELRTSHSEEGIASRIAEHAAWGHGRPLDEYAQILAANAEQVRNDIAALTRALAHKRGQSVTDVESSVEAKVSKKVRSILRTRE